MIRPFSIAVGALAVAATSAVLAADYRLGPLTVSNPWSRETAPAQTVGGGFVTILNGGKVEDRLVAASSPVAGEVQLHTMSMDGGIMRMRQLQGGIPVPAGGRVELRPGGLHLMFIGLKRPLRQGERIPVTLRFQRAGQVTVRFAVQPIASSGPMETDHGER